MSDLIGIDIRREACLALVNVYTGESGETFEMETDPEPLSKEIIQASRVSGREIVYPEIEEVHKAGMEAAGCPEALTGYEKSIGKIPGAGRIYHRDVNERSVSDTRKQSSGEDQGAILSIEPCFWMIFKLC